MPRFYVKNKENKWNIFSTIVEDFLYDDFVPFDYLVEDICSEVEETKRKELKTLLTDKPELNVMPYEEAMERKK